MNFQNLNHLEKQTYYEFSKFESFEKNWGRLVNILFDNVKKSKGASLYETCLLGLDILIGKVENFSKSPWKKNKKVVSGDIMTKPCFWDETFCRMPI